jgi:hypothetical protein
MWEGIADLMGGGSLSQVLFHLMLTTFWAPLNAALALFMKPRGLIVIGLAEGLLMSMALPPLGFLLWEGAAIALSLALSYAWVYYERPRKWDRLGLPVGALLVALGINGIIALATLL